MKIINQSDAAVYYEISSSGGMNCGSVEANGDSPDLGFDNSQNVQVKVCGASGSAGVEPLTITIPNTGAGRAVTVSLAFE